MVSTSDFDSGNLGSIPGTAYDHFLALNFLSGLSRSEVSFFVFFVV